MIATTYTAVASDQKTQVEVPADLLPRLHRANELLDRELIKLSARFGISANWKVRIPPNGPRNIELHLGIADPDSAGVTSNLIPESSLGDDESTLSALRPTFMKLARALNEVVGLQLQHIREGLRRDRETFASAVEA